MAANHVRAQPARTDQQMKSRVAMADEQWRKRRACALAFCLLVGVALAVLEHLPPLVMTNAEEVISGTNTVPTPPVATSTSNAPAKPETEEQQPNPFEVNPFLEHQPPPASPVVPWESLMPYFTTSLGTNRAATISMPLNFMPPLLATPQSSKATYSTAP